MLPKHSKSRFLDKLHKFGVYTCMGLTVYGLSLAGFKIYQYIYYTKPEMEAKREALKNEIRSETKALTATAYTT